LADLSARFVSLPAEAVDGEILSALDRAGTYLDVDRVILVEFTEDGSAAVVKHSWAAAGIEAIEAGAVMGSRLPRVFAALRRGEIVGIPDTGALTPDWAIDLQEFRRSGAQAHLSIPFAVAGAPVGILTFVSVHDRREWPDDLIERLSVLAQVFGNALSRRDSERRLRSALAEVEELKSHLEAENLYLRSEIGEQYDLFEGIVGKNEGLKRVLLAVEQVAPTNVTVLIQGETGTGKELIARAIHARSTRSERPLICVNCAAIPSALAESELFGHEKGAFTGAVRRQIGRFELADGGTILLDEVGDLPLEIQAKLLRMLQDGGFERLGSTQTRSTDARLLAATSRNLEEAVDEGSFRADLYYRLHVVPIELPALRQRRDDIPILVWHFIEKSRAKHGKAVRDVPADVMNALVAYDWPGNVRELEHVIERAIVLSRGPALTLEDALMHGSATATQADSVSSIEDLAGLERSHIMHVLDRCDWKVKGPGNAADRLGLHPSTLRGRMRKFAIVRPA
jgi:transcriptional regulator with GAF, ATPase, and Fis domain